jgi:hypothetical protein
LKIKLKGQHSDTIDVKKAESEAVLNILTNGRSVENCTYAERVIGDGGQ